MRFCFTAHLRHYLGFILVIDKNYIHIILCWFYIALSPGLNGFDTVLDSFGFAFKLIIDKEYPD